MVLRQVVSEIRWLLTHSPDVRAGMIRLMRRYEDELYTTPTGDPNGERTPPPTTPAAKIIPFVRPRSAAPGRQHP
jgi:hypothetical protein